MRLRSLVESQQNEINDYRRRLGLPSVPPPLPSPHYHNPNQMSEGLGLSMGNDEWGPGVDEKMRKD